MKRKKKHSHRMRLEPKPAKSMRDLERHLKPRQMFALRHPVAVGVKKIDADSRFERTQVIGNAEWRTRTLLVMEGSPNLLGPCWRVTIELRRADSLDGRVVLVSEWSDTDREQAQAIARYELRGVGFGNEIDVYVHDYQLEAFRLAKVLEAAVAESMLQRDAAAAAPPPGPEASS